MSGFRVYEIALDERRGALALSPLPGGGGAYADDLAALCDWAPDVVVSLTESGEMRAGGAGALSADLAARSIAWHHAPIADFTAPSAGALDPLCETLAARLAGGARILLHCRGGCGRSGMLALRLLTDLGEDAQAALARLRAARPCAVETDAQMRWATRGTITRATP